jgi:hypothetical protein
MALIILSDKMATPRVKISRGSGNVAVYPELHRIMIANHNNARNLRREPADETKKTSKAKRLLRK